MEFAIGPARALGQCPMSLSRQDILRELEGSPLPLCYIEAEHGREEDRMQGFRIAMAERRARPPPGRSFAAMGPVVQGRDLVVAAELYGVTASGRLRGTYVCEEHVVQTIVAATFPDRLADCRRYIDWVEGDDSPRPLARGDQKAIAESGAWFARKFALTHDDFFLRLPPYS